MEVTYITFARLSCLNESDRNELFYVMVATAYTILLRFKLYGYDALHQVNIDVFFLE